MAKYKLGDIAPIQQGSVPESESYWLLNLDMVESNTGHIYERLYVPFDKVGTSTIAFDTNNVLYSKLRPYLNKVVIPDCPGYATSEMLPLKPNKNYITREYLTYFLRSPKFVAYINEKTSGAKMPRANSSDLKSVEIECPTLENQRHITSEFDRIISIVRLRQQQLQKMDELVKARFVEMFGDPMTDISKWSTSTIGEQFNVTSGGTPATGEKAYWENGTIPWIGSNMCQDTILSGNDGKFITEEGYTHSSAKWFHKGTVLVALVGATIGKTALLRFDTTTNQNIAAIDVNNNVAFSSEFVFYHMQMLYSKFMEIGSGKFKMANQGFIRQLPLICPPIELQDQFAAFVEQTDKSKVAVQKALDEAQLLFDSLMQKYFG
ncbi:restriction endonuclease subunit S [Agathobaculum hominis]|uniref:Restriction endonuclease subunit S n=1 Tax=Agathobaculum hominis TaxID=2763014 RepID=A0ABR7GQT6_9FIRM|nr:restriction endonuclease subunit S [Agathobaculum hominis]MBC5696670.1 restriction endonuclease subunit S [Agathobaculum hominis]